MKKPRPSFPAPGTPEAECCHFLGLFAHLWIASMIILLIVATLKA